MRRRRRSSPEPLPGAETLSERPLISVVVPTYETDPRHLREAIASVRAQTYPDWELILVDDGSQRRTTRSALLREASHDRRITAKLLERNSGISIASNTGLELCRGDLVAFLDHDDVLAPDALLRVAQAFAGGDADVVYTDQDKLDARGRHTDPFLKPDWSPVYALGAMYVGHLLTARRELVADAGGFDPAFDTIQDFELLLRLAERTDRIRHVREVLYHWRAIPGSIALGEGEKPGVTELQARAVNAHLRRRALAVEAHPHPEHPHRLQLRPRGGQPRPSVTAVIAAPAGPEGARARLLERTAYDGLEVIAEAPENGGGRAEMANRSARRARGEWLVFIGDEIEAAEPDWLERLLLFAGMPGVGGVCPILAHPDGRVSAAGFVIGLYDPTAPAMPGFDAGGDGYYGSLSCAREVSAAGIGCLLIRRSLFEQMDGFDEAYRRQFHDHDLCLRLSERGLSTVCVAGPPAIDHTTEAHRRTAFDVLDRALFVDRWYGRLAAGDPYYGAGFLREAADYRPSPFEGDPLELAMAEAAR